MSKVTLADHPALGVEVLVEGSGPDLFLLGLGLACHRQFR